MDKEKNSKLFSEKKIKWATNKIEKQVTKKLEKKVGKKVANSMISLTKTIVEEYKNNPIKVVEETAKISDCKEKSGIESFTDEAKNDENLE